MSKDARIYARAEEAYRASLRQRQENAQKRADELSNECPRIGEIIAEMQLSGLAAVRAALECTPEEVNAQVEKIAKRNLNLQAERGELLTERGFPVDYLYAGPYCDICGDTGSVNGKMCVCFRPFYIQELTRELNRITGTEGVTFSSRLERIFLAASGTSPEIQIEYRKVLERCKKYAAEVQIGTKGLLIQGDSGRGKTTLALCIAQEAIKRAVTTLYVTASTLFSLREEERFQGNEGASAELIRYYNCDLLIIDDLGLESISQDNTATLLALLKARKVKALPTIVCTILDEKEMRIKYSLVVASRLCYELDNIFLKGRDIRMYMQSYGAQL